MNRFLMSTWNDVNGAWHIYCTKPCYFSFETGSEETFFEVQRNHIKTAHKDG